MTAYGHCFDGVILHNYKKLHSSIDHPVSSTVHPNQSLHDNAADQLRERIFAGELAPGSLVDEVAWCEALAISRTPLREALKVLAAEGLVRHEPRRGCFVNQVTEADLDGIFPVIALLEGRCAYEAARQATGAELDALEVWHQRLADHAVAHQRVLRCQSGDP
jgi:DNA-binding GntR family transcriptional regulator